ncbi:MAG: hypothetical protein ACLGXA_13855 [Acidobacteriota bacterium]
MNIPPVSALASAYNLPPTAKAAPAPQAASPVQDRVTLSSVAQNAGAAGDVDHDGDSH